MSVLVPFRRTRRARQAMLPVAAATALLAVGLLGACGGDDGSAPPAEAATAPVVAGEPFPEARCEANRAAGTITYLSGFDFAATASIVEVLVASSKGYFEELCLDVEVRPSFSTANYPFIAANSAQFASGGSFSEVVDFADKNDADFVVVAVEGKTPIDALIVKPGMATTLDDLRGTTIGVKGKISTSVAAMLAQAGLLEGRDYETLLLEGFDPRAHIEIPMIVGFPGWKSNEPGQLDRAGVDYTLFDPADYDIPGSFGILFTNARFLAEHPTAAEDFLRAAMRGLADAVADPTAAAELAVSFINSGGNPNFLSPEGEIFRWNVDAGLVRDATPAGQPLGVPDAALLLAEVEAFASVGLFGGTTPDLTGRFDATWADAVYDGAGKVIWPG